MGNRRDITYGLNVNSEHPLDNRTVVASIAERDQLITDNVAYEGQLVYVENVNIIYLLTDLANSQWRDVLSGPSGALSFEEVTVNSDLTRNHIYEIGAESLTLTLPTEPSSGDTIYFSNSRSLVGTIIARSDRNIMRLDEDMELDNPHASFCLIYTDPTNGWVIIGGDGGGAFVASQAGSQRNFGTGVNDIAEFARGDTNAQIPESRIPASIARDSELPDVSSFITADSTDTLTNKSIDAGQLTGTISADRLPDIQYGDVFTYTAADATLANFTAAWIGGVTTGISPVPTSSSVLHSGDIVIIVDTTPDPDSTLTYLYSGPDSTFDQFVGNDDFRQISYSGNLLTEAAADARYVRPDSTDTLTNKSIDSSQLTGTIDEARIPASITRDTELSDFITADSTDTLTNKSIDATQLTGTIDDARIASNIVRDTEIADFITADSGDTLTNKIIDAGQLVGIIDDGRIPSGIARDSEIINVVANPGGTGLATLSTITIGNTDYQIEASGSGGTTLTSLTLTDSEFNVNGETVSFTISGGPGVQFNLSFDMVSPSGWITTGALSSASGTIPIDGTFEGTMTFPNTDMTVNRTARLVATNANDSGNTVNSGLFRQIVGHGQQGDLVAAFELDITGSTVSSSATIIGGDAPFTLELFDTDPSTGTPTALQTATISNAASRTSPQTHQFTDIDVSAFTPGDYTYYLRVTDSGTGPDMDVLIESESFRILSGGDTVSTMFSNLYYRDTTPDGPGLPISVNTYDSNIDIEMRLTQNGVLAHSISDTRDNRSRPIGGDPRIRRRAVGGDPVVDAGTYNVSFFNTASSPEHQIGGSFDMTIHDLDIVPSFSDIEIGQSWARSTFGNITLNCTIATAPSLGFDYVTSHQDNVPVGSNRIFATTTSPAVSSTRSIFWSNEFSSGTELTLRPWVCNNSDPSAAGAQFTFGPITQLTIP